MTLPATAVSATVWARYQYGEDLVKKPAEAMQE